MLQNLGLTDLLVAAAILVPLERLAPLSRGRPALRRLAILDLCHVFYSGLLIKSGLIVLVGAAVFLGQSFTPAAISTVIAAQPIWLQFIEATILADLVFYAVHRAFHAVPALWRIHKIHHGIEEMDWLAAYRVHPIDQVLTKGLSLFPIFALGFSAPALALFLVVYRWQSLLIHSNANVRFGPFRWIVASPRFHHWHHANHPEAIDRNFAGQLPFIDLLFGTAHMPKDRMPQRYGVDNPPPENYLGQLLYPFRRHADAEIEPATRLAS